MCHTLEGSATAEGRTLHARGLISEAGIASDRLKQTCYKSSEELEKELDAFYKSL
jgi:hypothetical protein